MRRLILVVAIMVGGMWTGMSKPYHSKRFQIRQQLAREDASVQFYKHQFRKWVVSERAVLSTEMTLGVRPDYKNQVLSSQKKMNSLSTESEFYTKEATGRGYKHQVPLKAH